MDADSWIDEHSVRRVRNREIVLPLVLGTVAHYLGKKATETNSHRWTVYLRALDNTDLSHIISKVTFQLHHSFENANREITSQPFEVTEHGWGEFAIGIKVSFTPDAQLPDVDLFHRLKLYGDDKAAEEGAPVVSETYDELVISEPTWVLWERVCTLQKKPAPHSDVLPLTLHHSEDIELKRVLDARQKIALLTHALNAPA